jgi:flavin-dependent dehydrogenase
LGCALVDETDIYPPGVLAMGVSRHGYVGLVRVEGGELNIAAAIDASFLKELKGPGPAAVELLAGTGLPVPAVLREADWMGTPTLTRTTRPLAHRGIFLIGDAAGYVEPFTGEGMAWAMEGALGVVRHVLNELRAEPSGEPSGQHRAAHRKGASWDAEYRRRLQSRLRTCQLIRWGVRWPRLVNLATRTLEHWPRVARPIIAHLQAAGK